MAKSQGNPDTWFKVYHGMAGNEDALRKMLLSGVKEPGDDLLAACNALIEEAKNETMGLNFIKNLEQFNQGKEAALTGQRHAARSAPSPAASPEDLPPPIEGVEIPVQDFQRTLKDDRESYTDNVKVLRQNGHTQEEAEAQAQEGIRAGFLSRIDRVLAMAPDEQSKAKVAAIKSNIDHIILPAITGTERLSDEQLQTFGNALFRLNPGLIHTTVDMSVVKERAPDIPGAPINVNEAAEEARNKVRRATSDEVPHGNEPAPSREQITAADRKARAERDVRDMAALVGGGTATLGDGSQVNAESLRDAIKETGISDGNAAKLYRHAIQAIKENNPDYFRDTLDQHGRKIGVDDAKKAGLINQVSALVELHRQQPSMGRGDPPASMRDHEIEHERTAVRSKNPADWISPEDLQAKVGAIKDKDGNPLKVPQSVMNALYDDGIHQVMGKDGKQHKIDLRNKLSEKELGVLQDLIYSGEVNEACPGGKLSYKRDDPNTHACKGGNKR